MKEKEDGNYEIDTLQLIRIIISNGIKINEMEKKDNM